MPKQRTFLAWIRTGIALMGFGFVVAHFGLLADGPSITQHASGVQRYMRLVGELNRSQLVQRCLSKEALIVALLLALLGIAMTIYLTFVLAQPLDVLHAHLVGSGSRP